MSVSAVTSGTGLASTSASGAVKEAQDRFLKLLVAQLQNQDPTNPMESAEMTTQLAQMSTVEGINKLNDSMSQLLSNNLASQTLQAAGLIGHDVAVDSDTLVSDGSGAQGAILLEGASDKTTVTIKDGSGKVVRTLDLGALDLGMSRFEWDGKDASGNVLPAGDYTMEVSASKAGVQVTGYTNAVERVSSVSMYGSSVVVETPGLGIVALDSIRQIYA